MMKGTEDLTIRDTPGGAVIRIKAMPGSSRERVVGVLADSLKIATSAPPEKGKANAAIAKTLAGALGLDRRCISLLSGAASPRKEFLIAGIKAELLRGKLRELL